MVCINCNKKLNSPKVFQTNHKNFVECQHCSAIFLTGRYSEHKDNTNLIKVKKSDTTIDVKFQLSEELINLHKSNPEAFQDLVTTELGWVQQSGLNLESWEVGCSTHLAI